MAKTPAMSIFQANGTDEVELAESYSAITDQIQKSAISVALKSTDAQMSGNPQSGSVIVHRLMISTVRDYGTARTAGEGDNILDNGKTVNINTPKEIVETVENFDLQQFGLAGMIERRASSFAFAFAAFMDRVFFTKAEADGDEVDVSSADDAYDAVEKVIQTIENVHNDNVDGVDRSLIRVTLNTETYGKLKKYIQSQANPSEPGGTVDTFNGVRVFSNTRQTKSIIGMVIGSIAQPAIVTEFKTEELELSVKTAMEMFFKYGIETIMPDLVFWADYDGEEISA